MKHIFAFLLIVVFVGNVFAQTTSTAASNSLGKITPTPKSLNKAKVFQRVRPVVQGQYVADSVSLSGGWIEGLSVMSQIASDTIIIYQKTVASALSGDTVLFSILPATAATPFYIPIEQPVDSTYVVFLQKKGSKLKLHYRTTPY